MVRRRDPGGSCTVQWALNIQYQEKISILPQDSQEEREKPTGEVTIEALSPQHHSRPTLRNNRLAATGARSRASTELSQCSGQCAPVLVGSARSRCVRALEMGGCEAPAAISQRTHGRSAQTGLSRGPHGCSGCSSCPGDFLFSTPLGIQGPMLPPSFTNVPGKMRTLVHVSI